MNKFPSHEGVILDAPTGCIEDRQLTHISGQEVEEGVEVYQLPGADAFFAALTDVVAEADAPGSVMGTFSERVKAEIGNKSEFALHNDDAHGNEYDGCGFLGRQREIYATSLSKFDKLLARIDADRPQKFEKEEIERMHQFAVAANRLAERGADYFDMSGGELVRTAVEQWGAVLLTYRDQHTAKRLRFSGQDNETYASAEANDPETDYETSFNADLNHAAAGARDHVVTDIDAVLFAELISAATVDVLGPIEDISYQ